MLLLLLPLLQVRPSPVAGQGVFAMQDIAAGTVIGAYPGRPRVPHEMAAKAASAPASKGFCFRCVGRATTVRRKCHGSMMRRLCAFPLQDSRRPDTGSHGCQRCAIHISCTRPALAPAAAAGCDLRLRE